MAFSEALPRRRRVSLVLLGLVLVPVSLAGGYLSLFFVDGTTQSPLPLAYSLGLLAMPLLLLLIGLASLLATNAARLKLAQACVWALVADIVLLAGLEYAMYPSCASHPTSASAGLYPNPIDATGCLTPR